MPSPYTGGPGRAPAADSGGPSTRGTRPRWRSRRAVVPTRARRRRPARRALRCSPPATVVLEPDAEMTAARERERGEIGGEEVAADHGDRPRERAVAQQLEVRVERALGGCEPEREPAVGLGFATAEVEAEHGARRAACRTPVGERGAEEARVRRSTCRARARACRTASTGARCRTPRSRRRTTRPGSPSPDRSRRCAARRAPRAA